MQPIKIVKPYRLEIKRQVRLELSADTLSRLLTSGEVSVCHFRCLDGDSKQCVRQLLLEGLGYSPLPCGDRCSQTKWPQNAFSSTANSPVAEPGEDVSPSFLKRRLMMGSV